MKKVYLPLLLLFVFIACKDAPQEDTSTAIPGAEKASVIEKIAMANGIENFESVERLQFTFNVKVNDSLRTTRSWDWHPKTHSVTFTQNDSTMTYNHKKEAKTFPEIDQKFINDQYWLLFPFHLVWDKMEYEYQPETAAPISGKKMQQLMVTYPPNAGYTPGDVYEIYFDDDYIIREWIYKPGGNEENSFAASWEDYESQGGIKLATMHQGSQGNLQIYFTQIEVE